MGERGERERRQRQLNLEVCVSLCSPETPALLLLLLLHLIKPLALLEYLFDFPSQTPELSPAQILKTDSLLQFECVVDYFYTFPNITRLISDAVRRDKDINRQREGVLVSHICREFLIFLLCCCSGRFTNPTWIQRQPHSLTMECVCGQVCVCVCVWV